ncbi:hypothetical protein LV457_13235 [Mycobacterium sp. MYCO198283]|uniref:hypothetical protein n=1 Tax=Mycobacterium sp. MYCO198283 TaxID=2883505 RepID=UPI001E3EFFA9|nr:hypothetical protein [Mycobacterium sp. MYCO198283]MCG5433242.1 hypothetical protein [Mycobacterium sp. MYCO198283]
MDIPFGIGWRRFGANPVETLTAAPAGFNRPESTDGTGHAAFLLAPATVVGRDFAEMAL